MCKLRRITHKQKALWALLSLWVIRQNLHLDKIHKNKIHSYGVTSVPAYENNIFCDPL